LSCAVAPPASAAAATTTTTSTAIAILAIASIDARMTITTTRRSPRSARNAYFN